MARLLVMYKTPIDAAAFENYYFKTHIPIAKKIPGLRRYEISRGPVATPDGPSAVHLVAILHFDDMAAVGQAFASPEGQAAGADLANFASGGADMMFFDDVEV
jgi:uncharacterized protein (TIGR02118 family)